MIELKADRRKVMAIGAVVLLAGCKVIPKGVQEAPPPAPVPSDTLPGDKQRQRIALLVPLSGPDAALGQSIANATTMALLDTNAQTIRITTYDTATGAAAAASKALQDGNRLILGPVSAADIASVSAVTRPAKVPLITYSGDSSLATRDTLVMGLDPANAMQRVVGFASSKGMRRFALLAPKGLSGTRATAAFAEAVQASGGTLVSTQTYDRGNRSIVSAATRLKARGGYDAVLIADSPKYAAMAAPSLKATGAAMPKILGTDQWSGDPAIGKTASLRGAWFPAISDGRWARFAESYRGRFGLAPYRLSTFGYDSVLLVVRIARDWRSNMPFPLTRLSDRDGFLGLDGPFRFNANGVGERALEVREARSGGVTIVSPAAEKFLN